LKQKYFETLQMPLLTLLMPLSIFTDHNCAVIPWGNAAISIFLISHNLAADILGCCHFKTWHM